MRTGAHNVLHDGPQRTVSVKCLIKTEEKPDLLEVRTQQMVLMLGRKTET